MTPGQMIMLGAWGALINAWAALWFAQRRALRQGLMLEPTRFAEGERVPTITVIIPARNEAAGIAACVASVLAQDVPGLRVRVVNDRSTDGTAAILDRLASKDPRLSVLHVEHLPAGWMGKSHALHVATRDLDAEWFLFLDADCRLRPGAVAAAVRAAQRREVSLLTLWPRHDAGSFFESLLIPLCGGVMALWFGLANHRRGPAFANGQFLLVNAADYAALGGHRAVAAALIEDVPLAALFKQHGRRAWAGGGRELVSLRMYDSLGAIVRGWSRIFLGALRSPTRLVLSIFWLLFGSLLPLVVLPIALYGMARGEHAAASLTLMMALSHLLMITLVSLGFWKMGGCDRRYLLVYPLSVLGVIGILFHALWTTATRRVVVWRDTSYRVSAEALIRG